MPLAWRDSNPQTHALDRTATVIGKILLVSFIYVTCFGRTDHPQAFKHIMKYIRIGIAFECFVF